MEGAPGSRTMSRYLMLVTGAYLLCVIVSFVYRGPILDEFWTMWMTDPHFSVSDAYTQRWSTDYHPPLYYFLVWAFRHVVNNSYVYIRLVNFFPFLLFIPALVLWKKYRGLDPWIATFLTVMISSPFFVANTADLRSYYALTVLGAALITLLRIGRSSPEKMMFVDKLFVFLAIATIFISLNIHYSASLIYLVLIVIEIVIALIDKKLRWASLIFVTTFISGLILVLSMYATLHKMPNISYMDSGPVRSLAFIVGGMVVATVANWGIDIAILAALFGRKLGGITRWGWSLVTFFGGAAALFFQSMVNHAMALNYVMDLVPLGAAFIADLIAAQIFANGLFVILMGLSAITWQAVIAYHEYDNGRWMYFSRKLRELKQDCPATQFIGIDQNILPEYAHHPPVSGFIGVFGEGYATVGRVSGVKFTVTSADRPIAVTLDKCPLVILSDHEVKPDRLSVPDLLRLSRISVKYRAVVTYMHDYQRLFIFYR